MSSDIVCIYYLCNMVGVQELMGIYYIADKAWVWETSRWE